MWASRSRWCWPTAQRRPRTRSRRSSSRSSRCRRWWTAPPPRRTTSCCSRTRAAISRSRSPACAATPTPRSKARAYVRRERFSVQRHGAVPMEPRGLLAEWDAALGRLTVHGAAKVAFINRRMLAKQMGLPESAIRMVENDVGGGFGARGEFYPEDFLIPFAARLTGRPVKWIEDRREHLTATNHARDAQCELEIACERDGTILALRGRATTDQGAYIRTNGPTAARNIAQVLSGPYRIPHVRIEVALMVTNKTPSGTYRGPGPLRGGFLSRAAARHRRGRARHRPGRVPPPQPDRRSRDALCPRHRRAAQHQDRDRQRRLPHDARPLPRGDRLVRQGGDAGQAGRRPLPRHRRRLLPRGRRLRPEGERAAGARADGKVSVYVGSSSIGQGLETVCAQIAADALEVPMHDIKGVFHGSTDHVLEGYGSYSSRSVVMGGNAIVAAAAKLRAAISAAAAAKLGLRRGRRRDRRRHGARSRRTLAAARQFRRDCRRRPPMPATSAPTATAPMPRMSRSTPRPAMSSSSTTWRSRTSAASSTR